MESATAEEKKEIEELPDVHDQRKMVCSTCHKSGHNKTRCTKKAIYQCDLCKLKDKHPELQKSCANPKVRPQGT